MAYFRKKRVPKRAPKKAPVRSGGRRKLLVAGVTRSFRGVAPVAYAAGTALSRPYRVQKAQAKANYQTRLETSDNVVVTKSVVIGKQRKIGFQEKVVRAFRPPFHFNRHYAFSAEGYSGRKSWFQIEMNVMNSNDLQADITSYKAALLTNTSSTDNNIRPNGAGDGARFYVDYFKDTLNFMNSSTNALTGKIHLIAHKRDNDNNYLALNTPITPVNMMMYYITNGGFSTLTNGAGNEQIVGNGWRFDTVSSAAGLNYQNSCVMPGSSINTSGVCVPTDHKLGLFHPAIKKQMEFWFRKVNTKSFSLKPGQQFQCSYILNDLKKIYREQQEFINLAGITYSLVVEFQSQIVGDSTAASTIVSTGSTQLSVIRDTVRVLGLENTLHAQSFLQTAPQSAIADANQVTINADSGILDVGVEKDL